MHYSCTPIDIYSFPDGHSLHQFYIIMSFSFPAGRDEKDILCECCRPEEFELLFFEKPFLKAAGGDVEDFFSVVLV